MFPQMSPDRGTPRSTILDNYLNAYSLNAKKMLLCSMREPQSPLSGDIGRVYAALSAATYYSRRTLCE
jgi:hypothetical protein